MPLTSSRTQAQRPAVVAPLAGAVAPGRRRGGTRAAVLALLAVVVWVVPALTVAGSSVGELLGSSCAAAAGTVHVGLVIDFGSVDDAGRAHALARTCVSSDSGADGYSGLKVLADGGHTFRLAGSGLLCAIDGYPATGCGVHTATGYRYWSYWHGGSSWTYSSSGPAFLRPKDGTVEGWHYVEGGGNPNDPPPGAAPASPCGATPSTPAPPTTNPGGGSGSSGGSGAAGTGAAGSGATGRTSGGSAGGSTGGSVTTAPGDPAGSTASGDGAATDGGGAAGDDRASAAAGSDGTAVGGADSAVGDGSEAALGASTPASSHQGSGPPVGLIVVALAVVGLGLSAAVRFRTRAES